MGEKPAAPPCLWLEEDYRPAPHSNRPAVFSTSFGRWPARSKFKNMPIQMRSNHVDALHEMAESLRSQYPEVCNALRTRDMERNDSPLNYFDEFDITFYTPQFLYEVLCVIVYNNHHQESLRENEVTAYAEWWIKINEEAYNMFDACHQPKDLFLEEHFEEYGPAFLEACFWRIAYIKENAGSSQSLHPSSGIGHTNHTSDLGGSQPANQIPRPHRVQSLRRPSHIPAVPIVPISTSTHHPHHVQQPSRPLPSALAEPSASCPIAEQKQLGRELYVPHIVPGQVPAIYSAVEPRQPRMYAPASRDTPRTANPAGGFEPFKATRKDYHSDDAPSAWSPKVGMTENFIAKYAEGKAGPFAYQRVPSSARERSFPAHSSQIDRGIRNPEKATSDDVRANVEAMAKPQWVPFVARPLTEERPPREYAPLVDRRPSRTSSFGPGGFQLDHLNRDRANIRDAEQRRRNAFPAVASGSMEPNTPPKPRFVSNPFESNQIRHPMGHPHPGLSSNDYVAGNRPYDSLVRMPPPREQHEPRFAHSQPPLHPYWAGHDRKPLAQMPNSGPSQAGVARDSTCQIWLGGLPEWASPVELKQFLEKHPGFRHMCALREKGNFRYAWATFRDREQRTSALKMIDEFKEQFGEHARMEPAQAPQQYLPRQHQIQQSHSPKKSFENSGPTQSEKTPVEPKAKQSPTKEQQRPNKLGDGTDDLGKEFAAEDPNEGLEPCSEKRPVQTPLQEAKDGPTSAESKQPTPRKPSGQHRKRKSAGGKPSIETSSSAKAEAPSVPEHDAVPASEDFPPLASHKKAPSVTKPASDLNSKDDKKKRKDSLPQNTQRTQIKNTGKEGEYSMHADGGSVLTESDADFPQDEGLNANSLAQVAGRQLKGSHDQESEVTAAKVNKSEIKAPEIKAPEVKTLEAKAPETHSPIVKTVELEISEVKSVGVQSSEVKPKSPNKQGKDSKTAPSSKNLKRLEISTDIQSSIPPPYRDSSSSPALEESRSQKPLPEAAQMQKPNAEAIVAHAPEPLQAKEGGNSSSVEPALMTATSGHLPADNTIIPDPPPGDDSVESQKLVPVSVPLEEKREHDVGHSRARSGPSSAAKRKENQMTSQKKPGKLSGTPENEAPTKMVDHDGVVKSELTPHSHGFPHEIAEATPQEKRLAGSHVKENEVNIPVEPISTHKKKQSKSSTPTKRSISEPSKNMKSQEQAAKQASPPKTPQSAKVEYPKATSNLVTECIVPKSQALHSLRRTGQHSSSRSIEKPEALVKPPMFDSCGGECRSIAGLPTPTMGQRLAELGESVWQDMRSSHLTKGDQSSTDKTDRKQPLTQSFYASNSNVEIPSPREELPDSKLFPLQDRFFHVQAILKSVTYQFVGQPQVTSKAAELLALKPPGPEQGILNLYEWMLSWASEAESLTANLPESAVYGQFLGQEIMTSFPKIKQALIDLSQEYFATQESQADFGNFTYRLHKVGGEVEDFLKEPIPIEHGNTLASIRERQTQLIWNSKGRRLMDLWMSGRDKYKEIVRAKLSSTIASDGYEAGQEAFTEAMSEFLRRPDLGAEALPKHWGDLTNKLAQELMGTMFLRDSTAGQEEAVDIATGVNANVTKERTRADESGVNPKTKSKKKGRKKKKSKGKNAATPAESPEPTAENTDGRKDTESGLPKPEHLAKEQKKDGLEEHEWIFEVTKREFAKHAFDTPGRTPLVYDFIPEDGPWGMVDLEATKAQIKSRVLEQSEQLLDQTQEIYRVESKSPPRYAWRKSREIKEGVSTQNMSDGIILQAMQTQFQDELRDILNKRLAEHADKEEAASALAGFKFMPSSSQEGNATRPDSVTNARENDNAKREDGLKENVATMREKATAIEETDTATKEKDTTTEKNNMTPNKNSAATTEVNTEEKKTVLRGGEAQALTPAARKKPAHGKGNDSWSVPTGEPVWGGSGSGTGQNSNKRKAAGGQKRKLGK